MSGKYQSYTKYKDSGVEWLGDVPEHWGVCAIKHIVSIPITDGPHETPNFLDSGVPFISAEAISTGRIDFEKIRAHISEEDNEKYSKKYFPQKYDVYMVKSGATTGITAIVETDIKFNIWSPLAVIRCNEKSHPYFVLNFLRSFNFKEAVELNWSFGTQQNIGMGVIENLHIAKPPISEQQKIVNFLDHETAKIDTLIEKQRRLIELLKEKRQAVISHAVTKGLNPNAPMKESGVDWLGEVPEHWKVIRLRFIADVQSGIAKGKDNSGYETIEVPYLRVANVQDGFLDLETVTTIEIPVSSLERYLLRVGDVLMNEGGDYDKLGRGHIWNGEIEPCIHQNHVFAIRPKGLSSEWLNEITGSDYAQFYFMTRSKQSTNLASISSTNIMELPVVLPPILEQQKILTSVSDLRAKFDSLTTKAQRGIALLQERRIALISAAVTGKIDVRNWR